MEHEQLFTKFNVSAARNLSLSSEVRMRAEYNILEKRKWRSLAEEKDSLLGAKDKEIGVEVPIAESKGGVCGGEVASAKEHNGLLEQECGSLKLKVTSLESIIAEKVRKLSDLGASSSSLRSQNQSLVNQVHELETSSADLREKLKVYEDSMKRLEEFQDNLMRPLETRLAEIDADFTRCCMRFQESFHPHLLNVVAGRRWLLTHVMKLLMAKCLNSTEYMEALENAFGRAIEKGMQEGLAAGIEHSLNFLLLQKLSNKKDASTWDVMDLLRLDDAVAEALGMIDLQPDVNQLMVPVHHKVEKMERNLVERLPFLKDVFVSLDHPLSVEALIGPPIEVPATNVLSTMVIVPHSGLSVSVEDYENPDLVDVVPENVTLGPEGKENIDALAGGDLAFSKLDDEARDAVLSKVSSNASSIFGQVYFFLPPETGQSNFPRWTASVPSGHGDVIGVQSILRISLDGFCATWQFLTIIYKLPTASLVAVIGHIITEFLATLINDGSCARNGRALT
ncbi:hypothetical protein Tco_0163345 [Tanacetum coccineum]